MMDRVHPALKELLSIFPPLDLEQLQSARANTKSTPAINFDGAINVQDYWTKGFDSYDLRIRLYSPVNMQQPLPALLWIHGGGYVLGAPEGDDALCQQFVLEANCIVASVDYRLAPENPYPIPLEDCYSALTWLATEADSLNIDRARIGIAGASAGGGLTASLALLNRDRQGVDVIFQMPLYPMINDKNDSPSNKEITENLIWNYTLNEKGWQMYLDDLFGTEQVPVYAAPARAQVEQLVGLPKTYTCIGQLDPFRDETLQYVAKLAQAGVDVDFHLYAGAYHAFEVLNPQADIAINAVSQYVEAVKNGLNNPLKSTIK